MSAGEQTDIYISNLANTTEWSTPFLLSSALLVSHSFLLLHIRHSHCSLQSAPCGCARLGGERAGRRRRSRWNLAWRWCTASAAAFRLLPHLLQLAHVRRLNW